MHEKRQIFAHGTLCSTLACGSCHKSRHFSTPPRMCPQNNDKLKAFCELSSRAGLKLQASNESWTRQMSQTYPYLVKSAKNWFDENWCDLNKALDSLISSKHGATFLWLNHIELMSRSIWIFCLFWLFCEHYQGLNSALSKKKAAAALTQKGKKKRKSWFRFGIRFFRNSKMSTHLLFSK